MDISVIICCYNSESRLRPTLEFLSKQILPTDLIFEVLLIDNNCTDNTVKLALKTWETFGSKMPIRVVHELEPGLTRARKRGISEAIGEIVIFCDDDNWLDSRYLSIVLEIFKNTKYKIVGGWGIPVTDGEFPDWFKEFDGYGYAVGKQGRETGVGAMLNGAAMALRREDAIILLDGRYKPFLTDRRGKSLASGGDSEICVIFGKESRYFDERLVYHHFIPINRLSWGYFMNLNYSFGSCDNLLLYYRLSKDKPFIALKIFLRRVQRSGRIVVRLTLKFFSGAISRKELIIRQYEKAFLLSSIRNLFFFRSNYRKASVNLNLLQNFLKK